MCHFSHSMLLKLLGNQKLVQPQGPHSWFGQLFGRCADQAKLVVPLVMCWEHCLHNFRKCLKIKHGFLMQNSSIFIHSRTANRNGITWHHVLLRRPQTSAWPPVSFKTGCLHSGAEWIPVELLKSCKWWSLKESQCLMKLQCLHIWLNLSP